MNTNLKLSNIILFLCIFLIFTNGGFAQEELSLDVRRQTFESVWTKISKNFYASDFKGVNWQKVREKYEPLAEKTPDSDEFHALLNRMVKEIKESHLSLNPPPKATGAHHVVSRAGIGVELARIENQILITEVEPDSPASRTNLQVGDSIVSIDGVTVNDIFRQSAGEKSLESTDFRKQQQAVAVMQKLFGLPDSSVKLKLLDHRNKSREVTLRREISKIHGAFQPTSFRKLDANIGYIRIPIWAGKLNEQMDKAFQEFAGFRSVIIDLRGNIGGVAELVTALAGRIMERDGSLGEFHYRDKKEQFAFKGAGEKAFKGKVIVLIDEKSASSSEVFAGGLQDLGRVTVMGNRSGGAVLLSLIEKLPSGGSMLYPIADFFTPKGARIEGKGVKPDIEVKRTRRAIIENRDSVLEKAVASAKKQGI